MASALLTPQDLSQRWSLTLDTLRSWRWTGIGPIYVKLNGHILYRLEDIEQFENERLRRHTADNVLINKMEGKMKIT